MDGIIYRHPRVHTKTHIMAANNSTQNPQETVRQNAAFLKESGWTFNVIGVIALIVGLITGISGIWITGSAAILSGCYLLVKSRQQLESLKS